jgi:hypothetical protein
VKRFRVYLVVALELMYNFLHMLTGAHTKKYDLQKENFMTKSSTKTRPFGVTVLAILAGIAAFLQAIYLLQALGILPFYRGELVNLRGFNLWYAFMFALLLWVYIWLVQMLWNVDPQAWLFLCVITVFNLVMTFTVMLSQEVVWSDYSVSFILNALVLIYCMLPGVKSAFGVAKK